MMSERKLVRVLLNRVASGNDCGVLTEDSNNSDNDCQTYKPTRESKGTLDWLTPSLH